MSTDPEAWFEALFNDTFDSLYRHVYSLCRTYNHNMTQEVDDILQETYALLWKKRHRLWDHPNLPGWLYLTASHKFGDHLRKTMRKRKHETPFIAEIDGTMLVNMAGILHENMDWIVEIVGQADYDLLLRYYDKDIDNEQLAKELGIAPGSLRSRVHRIIRPLRARNFLVFFILLYNIPWQ